jgi:MFS family permease
MTSAEQHAVGAEAVERSLRLSVLDGLFFAVMVGVGESYLGALAVELGHGSEHLALLSTLPLLSAALVQFFVPSLVERLGSRKRLVVSAVTLQALVQPLLVVIALRGERSFAVLLLASVLYWTTGGMAGAAWSAWMETLTQGIPRERYFGVRSAAVQAVLLLAFVSAGAYLRAQSAAGTVLLGFAVLFAIGTVARALSAAALAAKVDPGARSFAEPPWRRVRRAAREGSLRIPVFIGVFMLGAQVAIPFFTPYMLLELQLDMLEFSVLTAASIVTITIVPMLWASTMSFETLLVIQAVSGAAWAGFEYASFQLLMRCSPAGVAVEFYCIANALNGALQLVGSLLGSALLARTFDAYPLAFVLSGVMRGAALLLLVPIISEIALQQGPWPPLFTRVIAVRPTTGGVQRPIVMAQPTKPTVSDSSD